MSEQTIEQQQGRILEYQHFDLVSVKLHKRGEEGVDMTYYNLLFTNVKEEPKNKDAAHPELQEKLNELKLYFATKIGLLTGWDFAREHTRDKAESLELAIKGHRETLDRINITGITYKGEGESLGVDIKGYVKFPVDGGSGISSGKITFSSEKLGYETEVQDICEEIKQEAYAYRFQNKRYQTDIVTQSEEAEEEEENNLFNLNVDYEDVKGSSEEE